MSDSELFGHGRLVNLATHGYADPRPARLAAHDIAQCRIPITRNMVEDRARFSLAKYADEVGVDGIDKERRYFLHYARRDARQEPGVSDHPIVRVSSEAVA